MNTVKVLHLTTDSKIGGTEKNIISLVTHLDKDRYKNTVVSLIPGGEMPKILQEKDIEAICLGIKTKFDFTTPFKLYRLIRNKKIDILHTYLFHANILGRIVGKAAKVPVIISSIRVMEKRRHHLWLDWLTNWMVNIETCVCEAARKYTIEKAKIRPDKLVTIPNGIDIREYNINLSLQNKKKELCIESSCPILGAVGRLHEQKGHIYLLKAMLGISKEYPNAVLLIAGEGHLQKNLEQWCSKLKIRKEVKFLGFRKDIKELITLTDVFILPSLWEGMPNVVLEAMALGKPIVSTRVGGVEELIDDGITGLLVPPGDEQSLAEKVISILNREDRGRELGEAAKRKAENEFSLEFMVKETERLYTGLLQGVGT